MKANDVKKVIQRFARVELTLYPESFAHIKGDIVEYHTENIILWARNLWESRTNEEISRDFLLGINCDTYITWTFEEINRTFSKPGK